MLRRGTSILSGLLFVWAIFALVGPGCAPGTTPRTTPAAARLNVLLITVDDLRPWFAEYGPRVAVTPNIDRLLAQSAYFARAYCQQALCNPSRSSLMTGRRPDTLGVFDLETHFRDRLPKVQTLPQYFKQHGYHAESMGKVYHPGMDDTQSWSAPSFVPVSTAEAALVRKPREQGTLRSWHDPDLPDDALRDGIIAEHATRALARLRDRPFFLAVGFMKPHLPFIAPRRYFELYPSSAVRLAENPNPPADVPEIALTGSEELRHYADIPKSGPIPDDKARELIRAYYASVSYIDAQIGRVLHALDEQGLRDQTIVVIWGDHGFHLGEQGIWGKETNFEAAARSPMIVATPRARKSVRIEGLVEFVDVFPSLAALTGLPPPTGVEGTSFAPLLANPTQTWKKAAFTQYPRGEAMGRSVRTARYRYTEWTEAERVVARELYDHERDPKETVNLANHPDAGAVVEDLARVLHEGWRAAGPTLGR